MLVAILFVELQKMVYLPKLWNHIRMMVSRNTDKSSDPYSSFRGNDKSCPLLSILTCL